MLSDIERWLTDLNAPQVIVLEHPQLLTELQKVGIESLVSLWQRQVDGIEFRDLDAYITGDKIVQKCRLDIANAKALFPDAEQGLSCLVPISNERKTGLTNPRILQTDTASEHLLRSGQSFTYSKEHIQLFNRIAGEYESCNPTKHDLTVMAEACGHVIDIFAHGEPRVINDEYNLPLAVVIAVHEGPRCRDHIDQIIRVLENDIPTLNDSSTLIGRYVCVIGRSVEDISIGPKLCSNVSVANDFLGREFCNTTILAARYMLLIYHGIMPMDHQSLPLWASQMLDKCPSAFDRSSKSTMMSDLIEKSLTSSDADLNSESNAKEPSMVPSDVTYTIPEDLNLDDPHWLKDHAYGYLIPSRADGLVKIIAQVQSQKRPSLLGFRNQIRSLVGSNAAPTDNSLRRPNLPTTLNLGTLYRRLAQCHFWQKSYIQSLITYKQCLVELRNAKIKGVVTQYQEGAFASLMAAVQCAKQANKPYWAYLVGDTTSYVRDAITWLNEPVEYSADIPITFFIRHRIITGRVMTLIAGVQMCEKSLVNVDSALRYYEMANNYYNEAITLFGDNLILITHVAAACIASHLYLLLNVVSYLLNCYSQGASLYEPDIASLLFGFNRTLFPASALYRPTAAVTTHVFLPQALRHAKTSRQKHFYAHLALRHFKILQKTIRCTYWIKALKNIIRCLIRVPAGNRGVGQWVSEYEAIVDVREDDKFLTSVIMAIARTSQGGGYMRERPTLPSYDFGYPILVSDYWLRTRAYLSFTRFSNRSRSEMMNLIEQIDARISPVKQYSHGIVVSGTRVKYSAVQLRAQQPVLAPPASSLPSFEVLAPAHLSSEAMVLDNLVNQASAPRRKQRRRASSIAALKVDGFECNQKLAFRFCLYDPLSCSREDLTEITLIARRSKIDHNQGILMDKAPPLFAHLAQGDHPVPSPSETDERSNSESCPSQTSCKPGAGAIVINDCLVSYNIENSIFIIDGVIPASEVRPNTRIVFEELRTVYKNCVFHQNLQLEQSLNQMILNCVENSPLAKLKHEFPAINIDEECIRMRLSGPAAANSPFQNPNPLLFGEITRLRIEFEGNVSIANIYLAAANGRVSDLKNVPRSATVVWHSRLDSINEGSMMMMMILLHASSPDPPMLRLAIELKDGMLYGRDIRSEIAKSLEITITDLDQEDIALFKVSNVSRNLDFQTWLYRKNLWYDLGTVARKKWTAGLLRPNDAVAPPEGLILIETGDQLLWRTVDGERQGSILWPGGPR